MTHSTMTQDEAERIARLFHETYERLAPEFGYETRKASAKPWEEVPENNRKLMIAVAGVVAQSLTAENIALKARVEELALQVEVAATIFDEYARLHRKKGTTEGEAKARRNELYAAEMRASTQPKESDRCG